MDSKKCQMCGGTFVLDADRKHYTCDSCGLSVEIKLSEEEKREIDSTNDRLEDKLDIIQAKRNQCKQQLRELDESKKTLNKLLIGIPFGLLIYVFVFLFVFAIIKSAKQYLIWIALAFFVSWIISTSIFNSCANPFGKKAAPKIIFFITQIYSVGLVGLVSGIAKYFKTITQLKQIDEIKKETELKIQHYNKEEQRIKDEIDY